MFVYDLILFSHDTHKKLQNSTLEKKKKNKHWKTCFRVLVKNTFFKNLYLTLYCSQINFSKTTWWKYTHGQQTTVLESQQNSPSTLVDIWLCIGTGQPSKKVLSTNDICTLHFLLPQGVFLLLFLFRGSKIMDSGTHNSQNVSVVKVSRFCSL